MRDEPMQEALSMPDAELRKQVKEATMMKETGPGVAAAEENEDIYTEQISKLIKEVDEIRSWVELIERRISIISESSSSQEAVNTGLPDVPPASATPLSNRLAELASHIAKLGEHVMRVKDNIVV